MLDIYKASAGAGKTFALTLEYFLQIRPRRRRTARPLPPYPRRDLYEQGHRRDEVAYYQ